jgi:hypothetical protein
MAAHPPRHSIARLIHSPAPRTLNSVMKKLILPLALLGLSLAGCAHTPPVLLCNVSIQNRTPRELRNFRIVHHPTERILTTHQILPDRSVELGIPHPELKATSATLSWKDAMWGPRRVDVLIPQPNGMKQPSQLIYAIGTSGRVDVQFIPCP